MTHANIAPPRSGRPLLDATRTYVNESVLRSWWCVGSTLVLLIGALAGAALLPWVSVRIAASILGALLLVRFFVLYHDYMHGAILRRSWLAKTIFYAYGIIGLAPPRAWRHSHNFHHGHVGKVAGSETGSVPLMTIEMWESASPLQRLRYRFIRNPLILLFAYITVFSYATCLYWFLTRPAKHWDSALGIAAHGGVITALWLVLGFWAVFFAFLLPMAIATAFGAYLFYVQHNVEGINILEDDEWTFDQASLESCSYLKLGPVMRWFTGNIGYHHVHHLNHLIPFYRLPEAMAGIPELQNPVVTTLHPRDIMGSLRLKLWDPSAQRLVGLPAGRRCPHSARTRAARGDRAADVDPVIRRNPVDEETSHAHHDAIQSPAERHD